MKLVGIEQLRENDIIADPVMTDDFQILLGRDTVLKAEYIEKLKDIGIQEVFIEEKKNPYKKNTVPKKTVKELQKEIVSIKDECANKVKETLKYHIYDQENKLSELKKSVDDILDEILTCPEVIDNICELRERKPDIYDHTLSLCVLTMLTALRMRMKRDEIKQLGTAALLHDLGLRYTTLKFENVEISSLSLKDQEEYKKHTVYGYSAVSEAEWLSGQEKKMILFHHDNLAGKGYPLHSDRLSILTQILAVCEIIDEMTCGIGYKKRNMWEVLSYLDEIKGVYYYEKIIDTIRSFIAAYPEGTKLILDDGSVGIVVSQSEKDPQKPIVQIIRKGDKLKEFSNEAITLINLEKDKTFSIKEVLEH